MMKEVLNLFLFSFHNYWNPSSCLNVNQYYTKIGHMFTKLDTYNKSLGLAII
jgi:hypothetical protein